MARISKIILIFMTVMLFLPGCGTDTKKVQTIEEAESFIVAKGFTLENKKQNTNNT